MKFTEDLSNSKLNHITGFESEFIVVQNKKIDTSHLVAPDVVAAWPVNKFSDLSPEHVDRIVELAPEVIILGTGNKHHLPSMPVLKQLVGTGIGYELMTTHAACRTYNILLAEGRRAVAALII